MNHSTTRRQFLRQAGCSTLLCAALHTFGHPLPFARAAEQELQRGRLGRKLSPYFTRLEGKVVRCELCPRHCEVDSGERGYCRVRANFDGEYYSLAYGNPCAVHVDPIEKKPFFHVLPTSLSFSIATAGCNLHCKFCQNWAISQARPDDTYNFDLPPARVVDSAVQNHCLSIASTYVEPTIFIEYMQDIALLARQRGLLKVIHSNGFINEGPLRDLCKNLHAACIDLKGFSEDFYQGVTEGHLDPVLDTLRRLKGWGVHTEIVNLIIPTRNDDLQEIRAMCRWIKEELGPEVPLHFTRFYPLYRLKTLPPTPVATLEQAWKAALEEGLEYVYIGNVPGHAAEHTSCPRCKELLVRRVGYQVEMLALREGKCGKCGKPIPGIWTPPVAEATG